MRSRLGRDFSSVRLHDDVQAAASADDIGARAYAFGNHVVLGAHGFSLASPQGQAVLAHELIHVMQQSGASVGRPSRISSPNDAEEVQARSMRRPSSIKVAAPDTVHRDPANKTVPADPQKPMDLFHYKCAAQRTLTIEIFFVPGSAGSASNQGFQTARAVLDSHGVTLNLSAANPQPLPASMGTAIKSDADFCDYARMSLMSRRARGLPVFYAPLPYVRNYEAGVFVHDIRDNCSAFGVDVPAGPVIVIDSDSEDGLVLLHELGHAVGRGHETGTFLDPAGLGAPREIRDKINNHQLDKFCNAPF